MSKKNTKNADTKSSAKKNERESRKTRQLTLEELKEVTGGLFTCDSNGPPGVMSEAY